MNALRGSRPYSWLALLAILAQLLLPATHAAAMGHAGTGDPLHRAFCGLASAQALQTLRETAPPELLRALAKASTSADSDEQPHQRAVASACSLCAGLSALQFAALGGQTPAFALAANGPVLAVVVDAPAPLAASTRQPSQRGPPSYS